MSRTITRLDSLLLLLPNVGKLSIKSWNFKGNTGNLVEVATPDLLLKSLSHDLIKLLLVKLTLEKFLHRNRMSCSFWLQRKLNFVFLTRRFIHQKLIQCKLAIAHKVKFNSLLGPSMRHNKHHFCLGFAVLLSTWLYCVGRLGFRGLKNTCHNVLPDSWNNSDVRISKQLIEKRGGKVIKDLLPS